MRRLSQSCLRRFSLWISLSLLSYALAQSSPAPLTSEQIAERSTPSVAMVLTGSAPENTRVGVGSAIVVRENGVLLTAYHVVKGAYSIQVRFKNGEVFDQVQLLGVDERRDVAAIKVGAVGLPTVSLGSAANAKPGDPVTVIAHAAALPWSVSSGVVSAYRLADEVQGAGSGYKLIQHTAPISPGSSGGVLLDSHGRALGIVVASLIAGQNLNFAVPIESVAGLADAPPTESFASGTALVPPASIVPRPAPIPEPPSVPVDKLDTHASPDDHERSDLLSKSRDSDFILRNFRTMFVDAREAQFFASDQVKAQLNRNKEFAPLHIQIVDDPKLADTVLHVGYTFAFDFPFELKHQNSSMVLVASKGIGVFSGPAGAADVARQFCKVLKPYRVAAAPKPKDTPKK